MSDGLSNCVSANFHRDRAISPSVAVIYLPQDRFGIPMKETAVISAPSIYARIDKTGRDSASPFQSANIFDVSRLLMHYASRKNSNYVTTSNDYHSTSIAAAGTGRRRNFRLPRCIARLALTPVAEIDTWGNCSVIRLISREINIEVSLDEMSCSRKRSSPILVEERKCGNYHQREYQIKF